MPSLHAGPLLALHPNPHSCSRFAAVLISLCYVAVHVQCGDTTHWASKCPNQGGGGGGSFGGGGYGGGGGGNFGGGGGKNNGCFKVSLVR